MDRKDRERLRTGEDSTSIYWPVVLVRLLRCQQIYLGVQVLP